MTLLVTIRPTIPDNAARTAFTTLRRLGVQLSGLERAELLVLEGEYHATTALAAVRADESVYNANTHAVSVAERGTPQNGEIWIASDTPDAVEIDGIGSARRMVAWSLRVSNGPADAATLTLAAERLLCNPAIEHVVDRA